MLKAATVITKRLTKKTVKTLLNSDTVGNVSAVSSHLPTSEIASIAQIASTSISPEAPSLFIPELEPVSLLSLPCSPHDAAPLQTHLSLFHALLSAQNTPLATSLLQKLHLYNHFTTPLIAPHNALIDAHLDPLPPHTPDYSLAFTQYKALAKYNLTPNTHTFASFTAYYLAQNMWKEMNTLLQDMEKAKNPIDLANLSSFMQKTTHPIDEIVQEVENDALLLSAIEESQIAEPLISNPDSLDTLTSESGNITLLQQTLLKFKSHQSDKNLYTLQESLEHECHLLSLSAPPLSMFSGPPKQLIQTWYTALVPYILSELSKPTSPLLTPYLKLIPAQTLALLTIQSILHSPSLTEVKQGAIYGQHKYAVLTLRIAQSVEDEVNAQAINRHAEKFKRTGDRRLYDLVKNAKDPRQRAVALTMARKEMSKHDLWTPAWPLSVQVSLGSLLASFLLLSAKIPQNTSPSLAYSILSLSLIYSDTEIPALVHGYISEHGKRIGVISYSPLLHTKILLTASPTPPKYLPMLVPPRPWITYTSGAYLTPYTKSEMTRISKHPLHRAYLSAADKGNHLSTLYHALDVLGNVPWRINAEILRIVRECWDSKMEFPSIPSGLALPITLYEKPETAKEDIALKSKIRVEKAKEMNRYSQRCDANYKILIAEAFEGEAVYFPHFLDFRGRGYPMPQYLNHIGNDLCRGLLTFSEKKPLGERGLKWLKIQIANLHGVDKISFTDREKFVETHLPDIFDSADFPLTGSKWWLTAEDPWQCLAACQDLALALRSPSPTSYLSSLPIHQDGTCNGLQHYAALGKDVSGAALVNLTPSPSPRDVYTGIAQAVTRLIALDPTPPKLPPITRKIVKQTVMTNTYGVTRIGAQKQIFARLKDVGMEGREAELAAKYITVKVFEAMEDVFEGARGLQGWLSKSGGEIAGSIEGERVDMGEMEDTKWCMGKGLMESGAGEVQEIDEVMEEDSELTKAAIKDALDDKEEKEDSPTLTSKKSAALKMTTIVWTSPLGLPIVQPYYQTTSNYHATPLQHLTLQDPTTPNPVDPRKQTLALPPNFVHSLDAAHMHLSAISCAALDITFASVHDSYWTHAADIDLMSQTLREAFVKLHGEDLMGRLRDEWLQRYKGYKISYVIELRGKIAEEYVNWCKEGGRRCQRGKIKDGEMIKRVKVWRDIRFDPLPKRGEFDIETVKKSLYFFH